MVRPVESRRSRSVATRVVLDVVLVAAVVAAALVVRYADPLSSNVLPAEDPYTHLVFTREHVDNGFFADSFHLDTSLYPPGLHAFTGVFWMLSGVSLYAFMLYAAPLWGGLAAAGMFLVGRRFAGPATGVAAGLLVAFMPEHAFRSNLYVPSAFDLALMPFLVLAFMEVAEGARAWIVPGVLVALALLFAHPWVIPLTLVPMLLYLALRPLLVRLDADAPGVDARPSTAAERHGATGTVAADDDFVGRPLGRASRGGWGSGLLAAGVSAALIAAAFLFRWDQSDSGFGDYHKSSDYGLLGQAILAVLNPITLAILAVAVGVAWWLARSGRTLIAKSVAALGMAGVLAIAVPTLTYSPPIFVDYVYQLGVVPIALALLALVVWPFTPANRVTLLGASLAAVAFPLTAINVFNSPYLPHRTVGYLTVGVAFLGAGFVGTLTRALHASDGSRWTRPFTRPVGRVAVALAVALLLGGALAGPGAAEPDPWYRYYSDDNFEGFRFVQERLEENPDAKAVAGDWRANMVLKSLSPSLGRAVYSELYYTDSGERARVNGASPGPTFVIVDEYVKQRHGQPDFTSDGAYRVAWEGGTVTVFVHDGAGGDA